MKAEARKDEGGLVSFGLWPWILCRSLDLGFMPKLDPGFTYLDHHPQIKNQRPKTKDQKTNLPSSFRAFRLPSSPSSFRLHPSAPSSFILPLLSV